MSISLWTISRQLRKLCQGDVVGHIQFTCLLTGDSDVRLLALLGSSGAPGDALAPVLVQTEDLLHLLPGDVNCHLHDRQRCKANTEEPSRRGERRFTARETGGEETKEAKIHEINVQRRSPKVGN